MTFKHHQISTQVLQVHKESPVKQMRQKNIVDHLFIEENDAILGICEWQNYMNLPD